MLANTDDLVDIGVLEAVDRHGRDVADGAELAAVGEADAQAAADRENDRLAAAQDKLRRGLDTPLGEPDAAD